MCCVVAGLGRGLFQKTAMVLAGLISINANAIVALLEGSCGLKEASKYWGLVQFDIGNSAARHQT